MRKTAARGAFFSVLVGVILRKKRYFGVASLRF